MVELIGEPGVGKTHLLSALTSEAAGRQVTTLHARCINSERAEHFDPFLLALVAQGVPLGQLIDTVKASRQGPCDSPFGSLHLRCGFEALKREITRQAAHGTLLLVLDDFHHADAHSIGLVEHLVLAPIPNVLMVIAHRTRQASARLRDALAHGTGLGTVRSIQLDAVNLDQAAELLSRPQGDRVLSELYRASDGVPAYLLELARIRSNGETTGAMASGWQWSALMSELTTLGPEESAVLSAAAVFGDLFDLEALGHLCGFTPEQVRGAVGTLMRADLIRSVDRPPAYSLRHPVVRSMLYARSDPAWRIAAHRKALHLLTTRGAPVEAQTAHVESLLGQSDPGDIPLFVRAAEEAIAAYPSSAVRWMRAALRLSSLSPHERHSRLDLSYTLARSLIAVDRVAEARDALREALLTAPPGPASGRVRAEVLCAQLDWLLGNRAEAQSLLEGELLTAKGSTADGAVTLALTRQLLVGGLQGDDRAIREVARCVRLMRDLRDPVGEAGALALLATYEASVGDSRAARATLGACTAIVDQHADRELVDAIEYLALLGWAQCGVEQYTEARRQLQRAESLARGARRRHFLPFILIGLGKTHLAIGPLEQARQSTDEGLRLAREMGSPHLTALAIALQSACVTAAEPGDAQALRLAETATATLPVDEPLWRADCAMSLAGAAIESGDPLRGTALILDIGGGPDLSALPRVNHPDCFELLTRASLRAGDVLEADRWAARAVYAADSTGLASHHATALAARAHVLTTQRQMAMALHFYRNAAELFSSVSLTRAQAQMLVSAAPCALALDMFRETASMLALSKELARRTGASAIGRRAAEQQLMMEGVGGRTESGRDPDPLLSVLTTREYEIASIASEGKRTKEIAQQLNLSARTIETHLSHVYRKLGVSSRAALASKMAQSTRLGRSAR
ncbi:hypothetical protein GCM10009639_48760 [Kitasatospora putterlickiae]|uniref:HTH luxR-type domain-containing protein n=1 Tax=Kitasatospora putterlickiae TaxID=221725 RepID=A0ABN1YC42_9ACTN